MTPDERTFYDLHRVQLSTTRRISRILNTITWLLLVTVALLTAILLVLLP